LKHAVVYKYQKAFCETDPYPDYVYYIEFEQKMFDTDQIWHISEE